MTVLLLLGGCGGGGGSSAPPLVVNSLLDAATPPAGMTTLRSALAEAAPGQPITFDAALDGGTIALSVVATTVIALAIKYTIGWRITEDAEVEGIDFAEHGETAYDLSISTGRSPSSLVGAGASLTSKEEAKA